MDALDADDNGTVRLEGASALFDFSFRAAEPLPLPGPGSSGLDPTSDGLPVCTYSPSTPPVLANIAFSFEDPGILSFHPADTFHVPVGVEGPGAWSLGASAEGAEADFLDLSGIEFSTVHHRDADGERTERSWSCAWTGLCLFLLEVE